jgi:uncharacterized protein (TIGR00369 family)
MREYPVAQAFVDAARLRLETVRDSTGHELLARALGLGRVPHVSLIEGLQPRYVPAPEGAAEDDLTAWIDDLPMSGGLGIVCRSLNTEAGVFTVARAPVVANPNGAVHGGMVAALADHCMGAVAMLNSPRDRLAVTAALHGQYHRPALPELTVRVRLLSAGRTLVFVECDVEGAHGRRCSTFQATMAVGGGALPLRDLGARRAPGRWEAP